MAFNTLQILIVINLAAGYYCESYTCDPVLDCQDCSMVGNKVPDIDDCRSYYLCTTGCVPTPSSIPCNSGYYFDTKEGDCVKGRVCDNECISSTPSPTENTCSLICSETVQNIPYAGDCSSYYSCSDPTVTVMHCPHDKPYFNGELCTSDESECCYVCAPECYEDGYDIVPWPSNCNGYYICGAGMGNECEEGETFNVIENDCLPSEEECVSYCT